MEEVTISVWHDTAVRRKPSKVVVKLRNAEGRLIESANIPSVSYPLNDNHYEVFSFRNTEVVQDPKVLEILDQQEYLIGHCYTNTKNLVAALRQQGYDAKSYVGWVFTGATDLPTHHCWCVLDGKHLLDLSDDNCNIYYEPNQKILAQAKNRQEARELMADLIYHMTTELSNSERIAPVGQPFPYWLYVGSVCEPEEGIRIYIDWVKDHPEYESRYHCDAEGRNDFQRMLRDRGVK